MLRLVRFDQNWNESFISFIINSSLEDLEKSRIGRKRFVEKVVPRFNTLFPCIPCFDASRLASLFARGIRGNNWKKLPFEASSHIRPPFSASERSRSEAFPSRKGAGIRRSIRDANETKEVRFFICIKNIILCIKIFPIPFLQIKRNAERKK